MTSFNDFYEKAMESKELPDVLQLQPAVMEIPGIGISFGIIGFWAGTDEEEGRQWMKKVAGAGKCIMEMTQPITLTEFVEANEKLVTWPSYGRTFTVSFKRFTPKTIEVLSKHGLTPPGGGLSFSVHTLRHPRPSEESVFGSRDAHHMLEIIALGGDASMQEERAVWASKLKEELQTEDPDNMVDSTYVSLGTDRDTDLKKVYGHHHSTLLELKKKYDAENVFKYAVPRLLPIDEKQIAG